MLYHLGVSWKKYVAGLALSLALLLGMSIEVFAVDFTTAECSAIMTTTEGASFYTMPDDQTAVVATVGAGLPVEVNGITSNKWYRVVLNGSTFYMPATALTQGEAAKPAEPVFKPYETTKEFYVDIYSASNVVPELEKALKKHAETIVFKCGSYSLAYEVFDNAMSHIGEIHNNNLKEYWECEVGEVRGQSYGSTVTLHVKYACNNTEAMIDQAIISQLPAFNQGSDFDKIKKVHDYLCNTVTYINDGNLCYSAYGALINRQAVCEGYATAFQRFMDAMGIPCYVASGIAEGGLHAWNIVQLDGQWYHIDATWADQSWGISDKYFLISGSKMGYQTWGKGSKTVVMATADYPRRK